MTTRRSGVWLTVLVVFGLAAALYFWSNRYAPNDDLTRYAVTPTGAVQAFAEALTNTDLTNFFSHYVTSSETIPLTEYLKLAGFAATFDGDLRVVANKAAPLLAKEVRFLVKEVRSSVF